jgi:cysteinyl-tRNA synthetase
MSHALLGEPFDIHGGGFDLIFPHHENEIAQTESLEPPPMANVWMHGGLLLFDNRKMSKSLGNFEPLRDLLDRHDPQAIRMLFLQAGYRKPMNFTEDSIAGATTGLRRLGAAYDALRTAPADGPRPASAEAAADEAVAHLRSRFFAALDDDVNTSLALSVLFDLANVSGDLIARGAASEAAAFTHEALTLLGLSPAERTYVATVPAAVVVTASSAGGAKFEIVGPANAEETLPGDTVSRLKALVPSEVVYLNGESKTSAVVAVIEARLRAKAERDFKLADILREALKAVGVTVTDRKEGASWTVGA